MKENTFPVNHGDTGATSEAEALKRYNQIELYMKSLLQTFKEVKEEIADKGLHPRKMKVKLDPGAIMPTRAHTTDAGLDLYAAADAVIQPGSYCTIETGVHVAIPVGYVGLLTSKSGLMSKYGITCRGTIDAGYTGAIKAVLFNHGNNIVHIQAGMKVTQLVIMPIITPELELVDELEETERGTGGFGSTGR